MVLRIVSYNRASLSPKSPLEDSQHSPPFPQYSINLSNFPYHSSKKRITLVNFSYRCTLSSNLGHSCSLVPFNSRLHGFSWICYSASYWSLGAAASAGRNQRSAPGILERSLGRRLAQEGLPILSACMLMSELGQTRKCTFVTAESALPQ